jgi:NAD(P)-dependent dehydrogenase (short-subunit alcohol dehydrogenase family)
MFPAAQSSTIANVNTVIIGATGGIGQALARSLPQPQILVARNPQKLYGLAQELGSYAVPAEACNELELSALSQEIAARGGIQTLVYAVGDVALGGVTQLPREAFERLWNANLLGFALALKHLGAQLAPSARIYVIGARPELVTTKGFAAYASAKAALSSYARIAELELKRPITVVLPPAVSTPFWARLGMNPPKNAIAPEVVAAALLHDLDKAPSSELQI